MAATCLRVQFGIQSPTKANKVSAKRVFGIQTTTKPNRVFEGPTAKRVSRILHVVKSKKQTFSSLEELVENAEKAVLVDFYATWCGPCQLMVPILNEVSSALSHKLKVVKIDTEKYPSIANRYNVEALPTFILFKDGKPFDRFEGAMNAAQLIQRIEQSLNQH